MTISEKDLSEKEFEKYGKPYGLSREDVVKILTDLLDELMDRSGYLLFFSTWPVLGIGFFLEVFYSIRLIEMNALIPLAIAVFGWNVLIIVMGHYFGVVFKYFFTKKK